MPWKPKKLAYQPVQGEAWYALDGDHMVHCGTGEEGKLLAEMVAEKLNLAIAPRVTGDPQLRKQLADKLDEFCRAALAFDPALGMELPEGHPMRNLVTGVRNLQALALEISTLLISAP